MSCRLCSECLRAPSLGCPRNGREAGAAKGAGVWRGEAGGRRVGRRAPRRPPRRRARTAAGTTKRPPGGSPGGLAVSRETTGFRPRSAPPRSRIAPRRPRRRGSSCAGTRRRRRGLRDRRAARARTRPRSSATTRRCAGNVSTRGPSAFSIRRRRWAGLSCVAPGTGTVKKENAATLKKQMRYFRGCASTQCETPSARRTFSAVSPRILRSKSVDLCRR